MFWSFFLISVLSFIFFDEQLENPYDGVEPILVRYMKYLRGDMDKIKNIGKHPGISCSNCNMNPIVGERFCCIECGGAEYDLDCSSLISEETQDKFDSSCCNLCCFCFLDRVHEPSHHFIVFIDDNLICESQLNGGVFRGNSQEQPTEERPPQNSWCELV